MTTNASGFQLKKRLITRRRFIKSQLELGLKVGMATAFSTSISGCSSLNTLFGNDRFKRDKFDVLVVGGGLAGLTAAYELRKRKKTYCVIEASSRLGGRVQTLQPSLSVLEPIELGAQWIDGQHQAVFDLCQDLSLELEKDQVGGWDLLNSYSINGQVYSKSEVDKLLKPFISKALIDLIYISGDKDPEASFFDLMLLNPESIKLDQMSLFDYFEGSFKFQSKAQDNADKFKALSVLNAYVKNYFGASVTEVSALTFLLTIDPDRTRRGVYKVKGGSVKIVEALTDRVRGVLNDFFIQTETRLLGLEQTDTGFLCAIESRGVRGIYQAKSVILTVPPSQYKKISGLDRMAIQSEVLNAMNSWNLGRHVRSHIEVSGKNISKQASNVLETVFVDKTLAHLKKIQSNNSETASSYLFTAIPNAEERFDVASKLLSETQASRLFKDLNSKNFVLQASQDWRNYSTIGGSKTYFTPGHFIKQAGVFQKYPEKLPLFFAGEHTSRDYHGTMQGAILSAKEAVKRLEKYFKS